MKSVEFKSVNWQESKWSELRIGELIADTKNCRLLITALLILICFTAAGSAKSTTDASLRSDEVNLSRAHIEQIDCSQMYDLSIDRYDCGLLHVPENYSLDDGRLISIPFMVIYPDTESFDATLHPLLVTGGGGPGSALLGNQHFRVSDEDFWTYEEFSVSDGRVLMLLENRGVGLSRPNLDCHYSPKIYHQDFPDEFFEANIACGAEHISRGIDLSQYNVYNAALDIEVFRRLYSSGDLDTSLINLYGVSYGTRLAMYYERLFPQSTRSMVLDSVSVYEPGSTADELVYAQRSLDLVFSKCRSDSRCLEAYGLELEAEFYAFLRHIEKRNIELEIRWPDISQPIDLVLTPSLVIDIVHGALYSSDTFASIPLMISNMVSGSFTIFTKALNEYIDSYSPAYAFSDTAFLSYLCFDVDYSHSADGPLPDAKLLAYWDLQGGNAQMDKTCADYGVEFATDLLQQSEISDTPVLLLSGELDPVTPHASAQNAAMNYNYHWTIARQNVSHDVISHSACARYLASWFVYHPFEDLDLRLQECESEEALVFTLD